MLSSILGSIVSWRTTLIGLVSGVAVILKTLGIIEIPSDVQLAIVSVVVFVLGLASKDSTAVGKPGDQ